MKKLILSLSFMIISFGVFAKENQSEELVTKSTKNVEKVEVTSNKLVTCGTVTNGIRSSCWSVDVTVTVCCDCELAVASMQASIIAQQTARSLISTITMLNEEVPC